MASEFQIGGKIYIVPARRFSWEHIAPVGVQTIASLRGLSDPNPYILVKSEFPSNFIGYDGHGYLVERCIPVEDLSKLERLIYGFEP